MFFRIYKELQKEEQFFIFRIGFVKFRTVIIKKINEMKMKITYIYKIILTIVPISSCESISIVAS